MHPLPEGAAGQLVDGLPEQAASQIPEGDVHAGDRLEPEAGGVAAHAHCVVHPLPQHLHLQRILADYERGEQAPDDPRRGVA